MPFAKPIYDPGHAITVRATGANLLGARLAKVAAAKVNAGNVPVAYCGASDEPFVVLQQDVVQNKVTGGYRGSIVLNCTANGTISAGVAVQTAADGKVAPFTSGRKVGVAIEAASADGDIILVALNI